MVLNEMKFSTVSRSRGNELLNVEQMIEADGNFVHMFVSREKTGKESKSYGLELYFYRYNDFSRGFHRSRYYKECKGIPAKYQSMVNEMIEAHKQHYGKIEE